MELISLMFASMFAYALFSYRVDELPELVDDDDHEDIEINDYKGRLVTLSCQSCRKLKKHREIEPDMYECTRCKRITDLRRVAYENKN